MKNVKDLFDITGKTVIITGGAGFLGQIYSETIAESGGVPIILDIDYKRITKLIARLKGEYGINPSGYLCDITNKKEIEEVKEKIVSRYGHIDVLINNAAIDPKVTHNSGVNLSRFENFQISQWNLEISVGLTGAMLCSQVFGSEMLKKKQGIILNISSDLGIIAPDQRLYKKEGLDQTQQPVKPVTYSVIKHGLIGLTKYIATYWADKGIRANTLCPGGIFNDQPEEFVQRVLKLIPLGRMAFPDELKGSVLFLISEASSYLNGATLVVDGGRSVW